MLVAGVLAVAAPARAQDADSAFGRRTTAEVRSVNPNRPLASGNGVYGRFDGDLDASLGAGAYVDVSEDGAASLTARAAALWFFTAGPYVAYAEGLSDEADPERRLGLGLDLRPLFLLRWNQDWQKGPALLDLTLDSLSLGLGLSLDEPRGRGFGARRAFEASLGAGVPLFAEAPGPWLEARAAVAWPNLGERSVTLALMLGWHFAIVTPLVR